MSAASSKEEPSDEDVFVIRQLRAIAGEHFEVALILLSREENGKTEYYHTAVGNQFAIKGLTEAYMDGEFEEIDEDTEWLNDD
jgi:hypothetical protein